MSIAYLGHGQPRGPDVACVDADRMADPQQAAEQEMAAYESYWHAHGEPAYAQPSARHGLIPRARRT